MPTIVSASDMNPEDRRNFGINSLDCPDLSDHDAFDAVAAVNRSLSAHAESLDRWLAREGGPDTEPAYEPIPLNRRIARHRGRRAA